MIIECPRCKTRYKVDEQKVPAGGAPIECIECGNIFTIFREPLAIKITKIGKQESESEFQNLGKESAPQKPEPQPDKFNTFSDFDTSVIGKEKESYKQEKTKKESDFEQEIFSSFNTSTDKTTKSTSEDLNSIDDFSLPGFETSTEESKKSQDQDLNESLFEKKKAPEQNPFEDITSSGKNSKQPEYKSDDNIFEKKEDSRSLEDFFNIPKTPEDKVRDLANRVVKELKMYYPKEAEEAVKAGKVPAILLNEIKKALQFYRSEAIKEVEWEKAMVYFRDAINQIIGNGRTLFR